MWPFKNKNPDKNLDTIREDYVAKGLRLLEEMVIPTNEASTISWNGKFLIKMTIYNAEFNYPFFTPRVDAKVRYLGKNTYGTIESVDDVEMASTFSSETKAIEFYLEYLSQQAQDPITSISEGGRNDI